VPIDVPKDIPADYSEASLSKRNIALNIQSAEEIIDMLLRLELSSKLVRMIS
jgi:hypothetical protein